jgi:hypothetical protein
MNDLIFPIQKSSDKSVIFGAYHYKDGHNITRDDFKKKLQKSAGDTVFNKLNMQKYVTRGVMENINKFVEQQVNVPFTMSNVYKMIYMIVGTQGERMGKVIVEVFDRITKHHSENRYNIEGWKTNDCFMVNKRFILPYVIETNWGGKMSCRYDSYGNAIDELTKALCNLTGKNYDDIGNLHDFMVNKQGNDYQYREFGLWYDFGFFKIKGYKKGTIHCEFKDEKVWEQFNLAAVKAKGWNLPETTEHQYRKSKTGVKIY